MCSQPCVMTAVHATSSFARLQQAERVARRTNQRMSSASYLYMLQDLEDAVCDDTANLALVRHGRRGRADAVGRSHCREAALPKLSGEQAGGRCPREGGACKLARPETEARHMLLSSLLC